MSANNNPEATVYDLMIETRRLTRSTLMHQHLIAQQIGLNVTDTECIDFLKEMGPSTAGALAKATRLTTGATTNVIDRLERAGFVKRSADLNDRRKVVVSYITGKPNDAGKFYAALAKEVQQLFETYSQEELNFLVNHTNALTKIFQDQAEEITKK